MKITRSLPPCFEHIKKNWVRTCPFQNFDDELEDLAKVYGESTGALLLLSDLPDDRFVGCVGVKKMQGFDCEMKRLYVEPTYRDKKYGLVLAQAIIQMATDLGYKTMYLDTLKELVPAIKLYKKLGFLEIQPYYDNPYEDVVFMKKEL